MATITGLTAERMLEIEAASVVDGDVVGNDLILARKDGSIINAGNVRGIPGPTGPMGSSLAVVTAQQLLDVGQAGQMRAGRQLTPADFTNMGLSAPLGLWNLSNANDSSGNNRHLTIKGGVPFGPGINGLASTAAVFAGATTQALYIAEATYPGIFQIKTGTIGAWFRTAKRGTDQAILGKATSPSRGYQAWISTGNVVAILGSPDGVATSILSGTTDVADDRLHFMTATFDATRIILYVDGMFENSLAIAFTLNPSAGPFNIGAWYADSLVASGIPFFGRVDEAFVSEDVLSEEQVRNLYCASIPHALGVAPSSINLSVRRKRRGAPLAVTDFPAQPARLHNFVNGVLTDEGSNNVPLAPGGGGTIVDVAGFDGKAKGAKSLSGAHTGLISSDSTLPDGLLPRSWGVWFKTASAGAQGLMQWGSNITNAVTAAFIQNTGVIYVRRSSGGENDIIATPYNVANALAHQLIVTEDNAAVDQQKRKVYLDGRLIATDTTMATIVRAGVGGFKVGIAFGLPFLGQMSRPFVYAGTLTSDQVRKLYDVGLPALAPNPKSAEDHVEAIETARFLATFDTIETSDVIDLAVMA